MSHKSTVRFALIAIAALLMVVSATSLACSNKSASPGDVVVTSSVDAGHSHKVTVKGPDIESPPGKDKTIDTTYSGGHTHTITLTPEDYQSIKDGGEVTVTSSSDAGHTHTFVIKK
jgi:hypothetical protein